MHPHLDFDLMGQMIEACREIGVKVKVYFTVGYSDWEAKAHPEWVQRNKDGVTSFEQQLKNDKFAKPNAPFEGWFYLEPMGPYAEKIYRQTEELVKNYDIDGVWYDIHTPWRTNYNALAREDYKARGISVLDDKAVYKRTIERYEEFYKKTKAIVTRYRPKASVFWNGTTAEFNSQMLEDFQYEMYRFNTKHDLEDLPTAWGGYDIFPWRSKYFANLGKDIVAMSGKFHTAWGEFGGFKHPDALRYEAASMIAFGANINIGDQLHPSGEMDLSTYTNIGYAFKYARAIEDFGIGGSHRATTGLYVGGDKVALEGLVAMLLEKQINFNVVNTLKDWSDIETLVITSYGIFPQDQQKLDAFLSRGGKLIVFGEGAFRNGKAIADIGARYVGTARYDVDYTLAGESVAHGLPRSPFLNYAPAIRVQPDKDTQILARIREPYFSRTLEHFSSHKNTPFVLEDSEHPAVIKAGNVIFFAHDLDRQYRETGARVHRVLFYNAFDLLRTRAFLRADMQSLGRINLLQQPAKNRYVAHLLYASPIQRGSVRVIEDFMPVLDTRVILSVPEVIKQAYLIPSGKRVQLDKDGSSVNLTIPEFTMHTGIVFEY